MVYVAIKWYLVTVTVNQIECKKTNYLYSRMYLAIILYLSYFTPTSPTKPIKSWQIGRLAQLVERTLSMREVEGSKPSMSTFSDCGRGPGPPESFYPVPKDQKIGLFHSSYCIREGGSVPVEDSRTSPLRIVLPTVRYRYRHSQVKSSSGATRPRGDHPDGIAV